MPGVSGKDAPTSVAVAAGAASSLDRLGLPTGVVNWSVSNQIAAFTSVRPGDSFTLTTGAGQSTISVSQNETFATLAKKINVASAFTVDATVGYSSSGQILQITPTSGAQTITFGAGPPGSDLLSKLGIAPGVISSQAANTTQTITPTSNIKRAPYALNLPSNLSVATSAGAGDAQTALTTAINKVKSIYSDLSTPRNPNAVAHLASGGAVPA